MVSCLYTPILRWKQGERIGLKNLNNAIRPDVSPLIDISQNQYPSPKKTKVGITTPASNALAKQLSDAWGKTKFFVDVSDLPGSQNAHHLDDIRTSANAAGLYLVPAIKSNSPPEYVAAVKRAIQADKRGVALRISLSEMTSMANWINQWICPPQETDLIIDLRASAATVLALGQSSIQSFQSLHQASAWRSVTIAGGSIPATLTGYVVGVTMLPRSELTLWQNIVAAGVPFNLSFGDYATIGPDAITEGIAGPVPINAKYTLPSEFAIFHGVKIKGPGAKPREDQYRNYASQIKKMPNRNKIANCWGDDEIDRISLGPPETPGSPASWVSYTVNRHIELTRSQLP